ncbi:hypothetical protein [Nostoc sp.]|uniref:hypothetical protein n=1 Tax=Nostoc sp. TaxID=1180 RepID=UPI002FF59621
MNSTTLNTAAEILEAFRTCENAGEEIDLFESVATRPDSPLEAFVEILKEVKLEAILALTIQAFGKITDADVKERLKQSSDLLKLLSEQAQSGKTDLIRWSAATTIENLGFDFISVSRHLAEEPKKIAEKIMQLKIKRFADANLTHSNDYDEYLRFWTYGNYNKLREVTLGLDYEVLNLHWTKCIKQNDPKDEDFNKYDVCYKVINSLALKGVKEINAALERATSVMDDNSHLDENEVFEGIGNTFASLYEKDGDHHIKNLILCLRSNNYITRFRAANNILNNYPNVPDELKNNNQIIYFALLTFKNQYKSVNYSFNELVDLSKKVLILSESLWRKKVKKDCEVWHNDILTEIDKRKEAFKARENSSKKLKTNLEKQLQEIKYTNSLVYEQVISQKNFTQVPQVHIEKDNYSSIFDNYDKSLRQEASDLRDKVSKFYEQYKSSKLKPIDEEIKQEEESHKNTLLISKIIPIVVFFIPFFVLLTIMHWGWAIVVGFFVGSWCLTFAESISKDIIKSASESLSKAKSKYSNEQYKLKDEEQKVLKLLHI